MHDGIPRIAGHKQDLEFGVQSDEFFAEHTPVLARHHHVGQQKVDGSSETVEHLIGLDCIASFNDPVVQLHQCLNYVSADLLIILHDKDGFTSSRKNARCVGSNKFVQSMATGFEASRF